MTLKRIRVYATLVAVTLWSVWVVDFSVPGVVDRLGKVKGTDFLQFYVGGSFVREGHLDQLYDVQALYARAQAIVPGSRDTFYMPIQSPQTSLVFSPLSALRYQVAVAIWIGSVWVRSISPAAGRPFSICQRRLARQRGDSAGPHDVWHLH